MLAADFHLTPSRIYFFIFCAIVLVSVAIIIILPIPVWLKLVGAVVVLAHSARVMWRYVLLRNHLSVTEIRYTGDKRWVIQNKEGAFAAELLSNSVVTNYMMLLHFKIAGKMLPLKSIIFRDSLSSHHFHQLLMILRN